MQNRNEVVEEGKLPSQNEVKHASQSPNVYLGCIDLAFQHFGGVPLLQTGLGDHPLFLLALKSLGHIEVYEFHLLVVRIVDHIIRLDVPVANVVGMQLIQSLQGLLDNMFAVRLVLEHGPVLVDIVK